MESAATKSNTTTVVVSRERLKRHSFRARLKRLRREKRQNPINVRTRRSNLAGLLTAVQRRIDVSEIHAVARIRDAVVTPTDERFRSLATRIAFITATVI
jgi:hypothetical protein